MKSNTAAVTDDNSPTIGLEQAAHMLRLGHEAMKELVAAGEVPALVLNQKHTVLLREDLIAYVRDKGREQAAKRRKLAEGRTPKPATETRPASTARARPRRAALPDLRCYEIAEGSA